MTRASDMPSCPNEIEERREKSAMCHKVYAMRAFVIVLCVCKCVVLLFVALSGSLDSFNTFSMAHNMA